jgi:DnaJ-class molecular chaperone
VLALFLCREGDSAAKQQPGDVIVTVTSGPHPQYKRDGSDLVHRVKLPLAQALTGGVVNVATLDGRVLQVPLPEIITPGHTLKVPGEGMPRPNSTGKVRNMQQFWGDKWQATHHTCTQGPQVLCRCPGTEMG